ncbi:hypothetical protein PUMCH_000054 [Australozyma saopauloensis]|uniref:Vacuolar membrane protein n=1 Tax=Australozyma saopauloensis TaxID=291208 RepID=A0AAX4H2R7_9ASCO|nr:hypothetical protein PUMCH_000054 [[Candida] saopauloensis]
MIGLPDETDSQKDTSITFSKLINCVRIYNIPVLNFAIILTLVAFLLKLTTKYKELYMKSSLITIIVTNLVLYGISESLAQTILSFKPESPQFSIYVNSYIYPRLRPSDVENNTLVQTTSGPIELRDETEISEDDLDRFLDYLGGPGSGSEAPFLVDSSTDTPAIYNSMSTIEPTYFNFYRLSGFMCWGFIMAFVQCWWYKFLQIYSKHPQFVEVLRKVMSDQFCFSPISLFCFFTYGTIVLENGTWEDAKAKLLKLYLQTLVINYSVWFPVQFINFLLIPRDFQVPFLSSVSVLWNCFLSMRNSSA